MKTAYKCRFVIDDIESIIYVKADTIDELFGKLMKEFTNDYLTQYLISIVKTKEKFL